MKFERGMGTLMTVFSGIAALMCLLVGLQLLFLEARMGQAADRAPAGADGHYRQWKDEVRTGAVMSFGAGVLVFLFGLRHTATRNRAGVPITGDQEPGDLDGDLESLSIRVFEVDQEDRTVEITGPETETGRREYSPPTIAWAPLTGEEPGQETEETQLGDPTDSILDSIQAATGSQVDREPGSHRLISLKSLWNSVFRPRKSS